MCNSICELKDCECLYPDSNGCPENCPVLLEQQGLDPSIVCGFCMYFTPVDNNCGYCRKVKKNRGYHSETCCYFIVGM